MEWKTFMGVLGIVFDLEEGLADRVLEELQA